MMAQDDEDRNGVLDLSVKKRLPVLLSPPSSTASSSSSSSSSKRHLPAGKRMLDLTLPISTKVQQTNKRPLRFQCKHCDYKAPSTSLMQNHIYRHTDLTPYACAYCGHRSTTKSTIMVHIELCHPNMEVKIVENRVREQDFYRDLNTSELSITSNRTQEPQMKKTRRANQYDSESAPINGVAISLTTILDDENDFSPASDGLDETDHLETILLPTPDIHDDDHEQLIATSPVELSSVLKFKFSPPPTPVMESSSSSTTKKESESEDDSEYLLVYNRPKQYYGSLYEPDKQYACNLCSYTTNHRPSMEDHVFVHTNEKPYKCGYCGEEIYTRYAATYHMKYKHLGMARNFIQNKTDISQYYVNRAKKDEEKNQFKIVDTRRVKVPTRNTKSIVHQRTKLEGPNERPIQREPTPPVQPSECSTPTSNLQASAATPDYQFLLTWSYYLATQAAWLSPILQQQGQSSFSPSMDPEAAANFLRAMQTVMKPLTNEQNQGIIGDKLHSESKSTLMTMKKKATD